MKKIPTKKNDSVIGKKDRFEVILEEINEKFDFLADGFSALKEGQDKLRESVSSLETGQRTLETGQRNLKKKQEIISKLFLIGSQILAMKFMENSIISKKNLQTSRVN